MLVRPTTAFIIFNNPGGIPRLIEAHGQIVDALARRDREKGRLWVDRHLRDWRAGFELSGVTSTAPWNAHRRLICQSVTGRDLASELEVQVAGPVAAAAGLPRSAQKSTVSRRSVSEQLRPHSSHVPPGSRTSSRPCGPCRTGAVMLDAAVAALGRDVDVAARAAARLRLGGRGQRADGGGKGERGSRVRAAICACCLSSMRAAATSRAPYRKLRAP